MRWHVALLASSSLDRCCEAQPRPRLRSASRAGRADQALQPVRSTGPKMSLIGVWWCSARVVRWLMVQLYTLKMVEGTREDGLGFGFSSVKICTIQMVDASSQPNTSLYHPNSSLHSSVF